MAGSGAGGGGGSFNFNTSFSDISQGVFGTDSQTSGTKSGLTTTDETITKQLEVDKEGILKYIGDILSGNQGLAQIFSQESGAGLYGGSGAKQGTEDLLAKIAGEIAKVTGKETSTKTGTVGTEEETTSGTTSEGLLDQTGLSGANQGVVGGIVSPVNTGASAVISKNNPF